MSIFKSVLAARLLVVFRARHCATLAVHLMTLVVLPSDGAQAAPLVIANPGFEDFALTDGDFSVAPGIVPSPPSFAVVDADPIPSWQISGQIPANGFDDASFAGSWNPTTFSFPGEAPEGVNIAIAKGETFGGVTLRQVLPDTLAADTEYTLFIDVGNRNEFPFGAY